MEIAKLQHDILKHNGDIGKGVIEASNGSATTDDFESIREMFKKGKEVAEEDYKVD